VSFTALLIRSTFVVGRRSVIIFSPVKSVAHCSFINVLSSMQKHRLVNLGCCCCYWCCLHQFLPRRWHAGLCAAAKQL